MRTYLTGNFLTGLKNAGVPDSVLWDPERKLAQNSTGAILDTVKDKLWLPTVREMFSFEYNYEYSSPTYETAENQARLKYYADDNSSRRIKYYTSTVEYYWLSSRYTGTTNIKQYRVIFANSGSSIAGFGQEYAVTGSKSPTPMGIAPAFCAGPGN
jgi:hypothetical protein